MTGDTSNRETGKRLMTQVYGWEVGDPGDDDFLTITLDHLFGEIWAREGLSQKERRLLLIGLTIGMGEHDVANLQVETALKLGELEPEELRDLVRFVTHYAGWPRGAKLNSVVTNLLSK